MAEPEMLAAARRRLALYDREAENIRAGQAWAAAHAGRDDQAVAWSSAYPYAGAYFLDLRLHPLERIGWLEAGLAGARGAEGAHLGNLGLAYADLGETQRTIDYHEQYLSIAREIGDRRGESIAGWNMSLACEKMGERTRAVALATEALEIYEQIEDPWAERVRRQLTAWRGQ